MSHLAAGQIPRVAGMLTGFREPHRFDSPDAFKAVVLEALAQKASEIFLQPETPILVSIYGNLRALTTRVLDGHEIESVLRWAARRDTAVSDIAAGRSVNERYEVRHPTEKDDTGSARLLGFRVNASPVRNRGTTSAQIVMRPIPHKVPRAPDVGMDDDLVRMMAPADGCVYVAGVTGSGKTTTLAAQIHEILVGDTPIKGSIVCHEQPIEFAFDSIRSTHSIIVQSEIGRHFPSFADANVEALRRRPALVMVGELRDEQSITAALEMALTGHPVLATVHATDCGAVTRRLISRYPENARSTAIYDIVDTLRCIVAQRLAPTVDGKQVAIRETLEFDRAMRDDLLRLTDMGGITAAVRELVNSRGQSFAVQAQRLFKSGVISEAVANTVTRAAAALLRV